MTDIFNRQNFNDRSSPLVILGVWPAGAFGIGDETASQEEIAPADSEETELVVDYNPTSLTEDDSNSNDDENAANDEGSQNENSLNSDTTMDENIPKIIIDSWPEDLVDSIDSENRTRELENLAESIRRKRSASCSNAAVLKIKVYYDSAFKSRFGEGSVAKIETIFSHMQVLMQLESISIKVNDGPAIDSFTLELVGTEYLDLIIPASSDGLKTFGYQLQGKYGTTNIHHYMLFSSQNDQGGVVGIAWMGTTCYHSDNMNYRTSLVEYLYSDIRTAEIAVHELGHSLGSSHDFDPNPGNNKYDSNGMVCTNIGAVMDYYQPTIDKWSTCSNEEIGNYFSSLEQRCFNIVNSCGEETTTCSCSTYRGKKKQMCCKRKATSGSCCDGCSGC